MELELVRHCSLQEPGKACIATTKIESAFIMITLVRIIDCLHILKKLLVCQFVPLKQVRFQVQVKKDTESSLEEVCLSFIPSVT